MNTNTLNTRKPFTPAAMLARCTTQALAAALIVCASTAASAATVTFTGDTTGAPTWNRTLGGAPPTGLSAVGTAVRFVVTPFQVSMNGSYLLQNSSVHDSYLHLYHTAFSPLGQFTNVIAADDDAGPGSDSQFSSNLLAGTSYFAVSSGFANTDFGRFSLTISGPGNITTPTNTQVPEPTSLALAGLALLGLAATRKRQGGAVNPQHAVTDGA